MIIKIYLQHDCIKSRGSVSDSWYLCNYSRLLISWLWDFSRNAAAASIVLKLCCSASKDAFCHCRQHITEQWLQVTLMPTDSLHCWARLPGQRNASLRCLSVSLSVHPSFSPPCLFPDVNAVGRVPYGEYTGWSDVTESMVTIRSPFWV